MRFHKANTLAMVFGGALALGLPSLAQAQFHDNSIVPGCDASGETEVMGQLLNAEPRAGVVTILKTPTHPGEPGPYKAPLMGLLGQGLFILGAAGVGVGMTRRRSKRA